MITKEELDKLEISIENPWSVKYRDVVVDNSEKTTVFCDNNWYLVPVNFKFGSDKHPGNPYLELDNEKITIVTEEYINTLPVWTYDHVSGIIKHNDVVRENNPGIERWE